MTHVALRNRAARLAGHLDVLLLGDDDLRLRVPALAALHELLDEDLKQLAQAGRLVGAIDDGEARGLLELGLGAELAAEELGRVCTQGFAGAIG